MSQLEAFKENAVDGYSPRITAEVVGETLEVSFNDSDVDHLKKQIEALAKDRYDLAVFKASDTRWELSEF